MASRNSPCPCGSGERYKNCCGSLAGNRTPSIRRVAGGSSPYTEIGYFKEEFRREGMLPFCKDMPAGVGDSLDWIPPGVMVVNNYLDAETCDLWRDYYAKQQTGSATTQEVSGGPGKVSLKFKKDKQRITEDISLAGLESEVKAVLVKAYREVITPNYSQQLDWLEPPGVLKYVPGGLYNGHSDSEYWHMDTGRWIRSMDRDFSVLLYINDDYEGGTIYFQNFDVRIKPRRGMLIAFPSDHRYLHAAEPLISGERYVAVCWATVKGSARVHSTWPNIIRP